MGCIFTCWFQNGLQVFKTLGKRAPASSGHALLRWVCPGDMADQGGAFLAFLAQIFTETLLWQNLKELFRLHIGKIAGKGQYKKSFVSYFFLEHLQSCFSGFRSLLQPNGVTIFMCFFYLATQISMFTIFLSTCMKIVFDKSFSPWNLNLESAFKISDFF